jgi:hypothetical protein
MFTYAVNLLAFLRMRKQSLKAIHELFMNKDILVENIGCKGYTCNVIELGKGNNRKKKPQFVGLKRKSI